VNSLHPFGRFLFLPAADGRGDREAPRPCEPQGGSRDHV